MHFLFALGGALVGGILMDGGPYSPFGFLFGGLIGLGMSLLRQQRRDINQLRQDLDALGSVPDREAPVDQPAPAPAQTATPTATATPAATATRSQPMPRPEQPRPAPRPREPSQLQKLAEELLQRVTHFFTTGNLVVRVGVVVLFIGVAFLLRLAYETGLLPVELRLAGAALGGLALTAVGWRFRNRSDTYGLILQGAGVGVLYLTIFASARLYGLLPMGAALALLVALVAASSVLAVVQRSQALAIFSMSGGFLAPVLMSTGAGSHVALFSYYALLNTGILAMAYFRHWRWLNWVGFLFTFAIGATWGYEYYRPEHFATTEPFLILFFFYYLAVSMLFARRQEVELRSVVDGTLVFGTPIVAFALQAALIKDFEFGLAYSALGAAATYTFLALWLKRQAAFSNLLGQSFVALGIVFATLAIPFAFDNQRFTGAAWAVEGAGLYWVGLRQGQRLPRFFGLLLQAGATVAFLAEIGSPVDPALFLNSAYLGTVLLSLAALFTAYLSSQHVEVLGRWERPLRWVLLPWGVLWWFAGGLREVARYKPSGYRQFEASNLNEHLFILFAALSLAAVTFVAQRRRWLEGLLPGFLLLPLALVSLLGLDLYWDRTSLFTDLGWLAWPLAVLAMFWHLRTAREFSVLATAWHAGFWWMVTLVLAWNVAAFIDMALPDTVWSLVVWGAVPVAATALLYRLRDQERWPFNAYPGAYFGWGWLAMMGYLLGWLLVMGQVAGDPRPLPYVVIVNPLELVQLAILLLGIAWLRHLPTASALRSPGTVVIGAVAFAWLNLTAARAVHFYGGVDYPLDSLLNSDAFQTTASILWTSIALLLMGYGARQSMRISWLVGAALLALVIVKLFMVDLGKLDTVARIVSFISVGVLMLVIGFFAPLPPAREADQEGEPA